MSTGSTSHSAGDEPSPEGRATPAWRSVLIRMLAGALALWALFAGLGTLVVNYWAPSRFGRADGDVVEFLESERTPTGEVISLGMVLLADTITVVALATVVGIGLYLALRRWAEPLFLAACVFGETLIFTATTAVVDRERPPVAHLDVSPPTSGFPSGHTAAAICLYGGIALLGGVLIKKRLYRRLLWGVAIAFPLLVAAGRLYRGMHFPSDVTASAILGVLWLTWMTRIYPLGKGVARAGMTRA